MPTYPIPNSVRLPASDTAVLAYSGKVIIRMPVEVPAGVQGPNELGIRFGYQLCDSRGCGEFATLDARANFNVEEPPQSQDLLAYRLDSRRVVIVMQMLHRLSTEPTDLIRPLAQFIPQVATLPDRHEARSRFVGHFRLGARWDDSLGEQPVQGGCGTAGNCIVALRRRRGDSCHCGTCYR